MNPQRGRASRRRRELAEADRLRILAAMDDTRGDIEVLPCALQHATAGLAGLGALAHLRTPESPHGLRLAASSGLPQAFFALWESIRADGRSVPARAFRRDGYVWLPAIPSPEQALEDRPEDHSAGARAGAATSRAAPGLSEDQPGLSEDQPGLSASGVPPDSGMAAVPLPGPDGPIGVLSVVTPPAVRPGPAQRAFLRDVARWAAGRLRLTAPAAGGGPPALLAAEPGGPGPRRTGRTAPVGRWEWDLKTGETVLDDTMLDILADYAVPREDTRIDTWIHSLHPDDVAWVRESLERAIRERGPYDAEYRVRRRDGGYGWLSNRGRVLPGDDGEPVRMVGTTWDTSEEHAVQESVGRALRHMSDGFLYVERDGRVGFVNPAAERLLGPAHALAGRLLWDVPALRGLAGLRAGYRRATAEGEPTGLDLTWPETDRWYHLRLVPVPDGLTVYVTDITERRRRQAEREAADRAAAERAALMGRLTRALAEAVTAQDVVHAVAESVLPPFGAAGLIVAATEADHLNLVGAAGYPPAFLTRIRRFPMLSDTPVGEALRTRTPQFIESPGDLLARYPGAAGMATAGGKRAWAFLPLNASGRPIGACVISFDQPRRLDEDERTLLTALSGLVAQALERAGLYDAAYTRAQELQRALLPRVLPELPAVTAAARYLPAGQGADVGGDWYDIIPLSADRVALVIGDVMGHGMAEAATMGRLRTAVRTLSDLELPPDDVLDHLNDLVAELGDDSFATCLYGIYDPVTGEFCYASAGHPPPATVHPSGCVAFSAPTANPPLGAADPPFDVSTIPLVDGSLLAFYTDGLVESRDRDVDVGLDHLARTLGTAVRDGRARNLEPLCDTVTATLLPSQGVTADDAALLIARTSRLDPGNVVTWPLPDDPVAAGQARDLIRAQFDAWHLADSLEMTTELLASELVGNVVRHAKGPISLRLLCSRTLICEVTDGSPTTPHVRRTTATDEGGRGLQLVAALAQRWGTRPTPGGKCIWTEQPLTR
ncbi:SpoIIE family protein phosphatase [Streptomyces sp. B1866]|uniref:ATP-binding SpoIIE family protein phosphatase n=1 Tax=Streptomyces sp. B1866 TaxID=3075431 RepID=UPI00288DB147|nr:SpoIIE family protein phosphatase [Streptomyces sp. B1866]MDT3397608.1 SpoIIE family protein phosphatase [Streptomyces sp. B1866]